MVNRQSALLGSSCIRKAFSKACLSQVRLLEYLRIHSQWFDPRHRCGRQLSVDLLSRLLDERVLDAYHRKIGRQLCAIGVRPGATTGEFAIRGLRVKRLEGERLVTRARASRGPLYRRKSLPEVAINGAI